MNVPRLTMIVGLSLGLLSAPVATEAQETGKLYRIGFNVYSIGRPDLTRL